MELTNENKNRSCGLQIGEAVDVYSSMGTLWGRSKVVDFTQDGNKVIILNINDEPIEWDSKQLIVITKLEDITK